MVQRCTRPNVRMIPSLSSLLQDDKPEGGFEVLSKVPGAQLAGLRYAPLFPFFAHLGGSYDSIAVYECGT
jgi:hypothetical protein